MCATDEVQPTKVINSPASRTRARVREDERRRAELVRVRCAAAGSQNAAVGLQNAAVGLQNAAVQFGNEAVNFAGRRSDEQVGRRSQLKWAPSRCTPERFFRCTPNRLLCVHPTASYVYTYEALRCTPNRPLCVHLRGAYVYTYLTSPLPHSSTPTLFLKFPTCSFRGDMVSCVPKTGRWVLSRYVHKQN